jgi:hypothetical protein
MHRIITKQANKHLQIPGQLAVLQFETAREAGFIARGGELSFNAGARAFYSAAQNIAITKWR